MSQSRKRAISFDGDAQNSNNKSRSATGSRPLRPVKRRRGEEGGCGQSNTVPDHSMKNTHLDACMKAGSGGGGGGGGGGKVKRQVWTATAIEAFSEGLCQHGKSFHRILKFMKTKYRKKNDPVIPNLNKDQVRFYYYRTWHKVSALLTDPTQPSSTNDTKKAKYTKSPYVSGSDATTTERKQQAVVVESAEEREEEGEFGDGEMGKERSGEDGSRVVEGKESGEVGRVVGSVEVGEEGRGEDGEDREEERVAMIKRSGEHGEEGGEVPEGQDIDYFAHPGAVGDNSLENTTEEMSVVDNERTFSAEQNEEVTNCSPINELCTGTSNSQLSTIHSPKDGPVVCEVGGDGEDGIVASSVMSEEEEGPLDSSIEDIASSPPLTLAPIITAETEVEVEIKTKENFNDKVVSRRDSVRGDTVAVNGVRHSLDLVALIAYFKLKKKCQADHNFSRRLSELVYLGSTTIPGRTKGKRKVQMKLSNCRALQPKSDNPTSAATVSAVTGRTGSRNTESNSAVENPSSEVTDPSSSLITPSILTLELRPLTSSSWRYVQSLSQNPRLRMTVESTLTLKQLQTFLLAKWQLGEEGTGREEVRKGGGSDRADEGEGHRMGGGKGVGGGDGGRSEERTQEGSEEEVERNYCQQIKLYHTYICSKSAQHCFSSNSKDVGSLPSASTSTNEKEHVYIDSRAEGLHNLAGSVPVNSSCDGRPLATSQLSHQQQQLSRQLECGSAPSDTCSTHFVTQSTQVAAEQRVEPPISKCERVCCGSRCDGDSGAGSSARDLAITCGGSSAAELKCEPQSTLTTLHRMFHSPPVLQLLYEILVRPDSGGTAQRLRSVLKIAAALSRDVARTAELTSSPPSSSPPPCHKSPVVANYLRSLPRRSPWKSPLSKYRRLKQRSPRKHMSPKKLNFSHYPKKLSLRKGTTQHTTEEPVNIKSNVPSPTCDTVNNRLPILTPSHHLSLTSSTAITCPPAQTPTLSSIPPTTSPITTITPSSINSITLPPSISTPSLSHLLTILPTSLPHTRPLPSPSPTIVPLHPNSHRKSSPSAPPPTTQSSVHSLTLPKSSIGNFDSLNLQGLFSVATGVLGSSNPSGGATLRPGTNKGPVKPSDMFRPGCGGTSSVRMGSSVSTLYLPKTGSVSTARGNNVSVMMSNARMPKTVSVKVVSSVQPRPSSTLPPTALPPPTTTHNQQHQTATASVVQSPSEITGAVCQDQSVVLPSTFSPALTVAPASTTVNTVAYNGISGNTLALLNSMRRSKRHKMQSKKTPSARQIVPRPLPFGPQVLSVPIPTVPAKEQGGQLSSQQPSTSVHTHNPNIQQQLISLLQTLVVQQQQRKQQQQQLQQQQKTLETQHPHPTLQQQSPQDLSSAITKKAEEILLMQSSLPGPSTHPPSNPPVLSTSSLATTDITTHTPALATQPLTPVSNVPPQVTQPCLIPEADIEAAILDNLFTAQPSSTAAAAAQLPSRFFHTSSDTVDRLLRGLSTRAARSSDSIHRLSQETACVLPTFARALELSAGLASQSSRATCGIGGSGEGGEGGDGVKSVAGEAGGSEREASPLEACDDANISGDNSSDLALSDVMVGSGTDDSTFQQLAENGSLLDGLEFPMDTLSQLPATPPRSRTDNGTALLSPPSTENDISIGSLLDFLVSPEKDHNKLPTSSGLSLSNVDHTYRSLLEETSVDYIQTFREMASQMNSDP